ncbi:MAG: hypothetical protein HQL94_02785 [Magnetococcales bacterium]|nr:hypothetical protein [Magnetococcales bacterium]
MDNHRIFLAVLVSWIGLLPEDASAFVVGDIVVNSPLEKKFQAEIPLSLSDDERVKVIKLGSVADYQALGLKRPAAMDSMTVKVEKDARILLTSDKTLPRKPMDILLRVSSTKQTGFPVFHIEPTVPAKVEAKVEEKPVTETKPKEPKAQKIPVEAKAKEQPVAKQEVPPATEPPAAIATTDQPVKSTESVSAPSSVGRYGPVKEGENLSSIARKLFPVGKGVTIFQSIAAIFIRNPNQFRDGNMNNLVSGGQLIIPPIEEMRTINRKLSRQLWMEHAKIREQCLAGQCVPTPIQTTVAMTPVPVDKQPSLQSLMPSAQTPLQSVSSPNVSVGLENILVQLQAQLGELAQVLKANQTQQIKLESRVTTLESSQSSGEVLANRVAALEKIIQERSSKPQEESVPRMETGSKLFQWTGVFAVVGGVAFAVILLLLGRRWNKQAQWENLNKLLLMTVRKHPNMVQDVLNQVEPQTDDLFIPSVHPGKLEGVPLRTGKKVVGGDLHQSVSRLSALDADREEKK